MRSENNYRYQMAKLGIFYCVDKDLEDEVEEIKSFFASKSEKNKYLNHLVHSTLYVFDTDSKKIEDASRVFDLLKDSLSPVISNIHSWKIFENDILTQLNTLCLEIELTDELKALQFTVVELLSKFHLQSINNNFEGVLEISNNKYGYPFVGNHWVPHITIGSLDVTCKEISLYSKDLINFPRKLIIDNLGLYKIEGETHQLIKKIKF